MGAKMECQVKVRNFKNASGRSVPNQFIITYSEKAMQSEGRDIEIFQSYDSVIARKYPLGKTILDSYYWDYSKTTGRYRNLFLDETKKDTEKKIKNGEYMLKDLNTCPYTGYL